MPRFRLEQAAEELGQLRVGKVIAQQTETLARTRLNQSGDQQPIHRTHRFQLIRQPPQPFRVSARRNLAKTHPAAFEQIEHQMKMAQFLLHDGGHGAASSIWST